MDIWLIKEKYFKVKIFIIHFTKDIKKKNDNETCCWKEGSTESNSGRRGEKVPSL